MAPYSTRRMRVIQPILERNQETCSESNSGRSFAPHQTMVQKINTYHQKSAFVLKLLEIFEILHPAQNGGGKLSMNALELL